MTSHESIIPNLFHPFILRSDQCLVSLSIILRCCGNSFVSCALVPSSKSLQERERERERAHESCDPIESDIKVSRLTSLHGKKKMYIYARTIEMESWGNSASCQCKSLLALSAHIRFNSKPMTSRDNILHQ